MNTSKDQWNKSSFVKLDHFVHKPRVMRRFEKRLSGILRADKVSLRQEPVEIGANVDKIQLTPILDGGQVRALRVVCSCGCESTFDIQYASRGQAA